MARAIFPFQSSDHFIPSSDGESSIFVKHYWRGWPRLHFVIVHGALEYSGRHRDLVDFWLKQYNDVAVTIYDHLGHGKSGGPRAYVPDFRIYIEDFLKVGEFVQTKNLSHTKTFICCHSMGGLITLSCMLDPSFGWPYPIHGLMLSSPCIRPKVILSQVSEPLLDRLNRYVPLLHLPMIYRGAELTRDPDRANDFNTDTLIPNYMTVRMAKEIIAASDKIRGLSYYLRIPSLFMIAGSDKIVDAESTTLFAHGIDKSLAQVIQYPKHYHELWNEIDREDIFESMKKWLEKQVKESL